MKQQKTDRFILLYRCFLVGRNAREPWIDSARKAVDADPRVGSGIVYHRGPAVRRPLGATSGLGVVAHELTAPIIETRLGLITSVKDDLIMPNDLY